MKYTEPTAFGSYEPNVITPWPFVIAVVFTAITLYFNSIYAFLGILAVIALGWKTHSIHGLVETSEQPTAPPPLGSANIRATFIRRVSKYRFGLLFKEDHNELVMFLSLSELAKARLKKAGYYDATFYVLKIMRNFSKVGGPAQPDTELLYRLKDIVEKGPFIYTNDDINQLNRVENELRECVANIAAHVQILSDDKSRSSTDTVEF